MNTIRLLDYISVITNKWRRWKMQYNFPDITFLTSRTVITGTAECKKFRSFVMNE